MTCSPSILDKHGVDGLATALDYTHEYIDWTVNHRIMARELDILPLEASIILQSLRDIVAEELGSDPETDMYGSRSLPIDHAIQAGWVMVMDPPDYTDSTISQVMDDTRRFMSVSENFLRELLLQ